MKTIRLVSLSLLSFLIFGCSSEQSQKDQSKRSETTSNEQTEVAENTEEKSEKLGVEDDSIFVYAEGDNMQEMKFRPQKLVIEKGKQYVLVLKNTGNSSAMLHNFVVVEKGTGNAVGQNGLNHPDNNYVRPNDINVLFSSAVAQPQETIFTSIQMDEKGKYDFICSYPGHWGIMTGTIAVE